MAITINLYTFSKRENSTKIPATSAVDYTCVLKQPCSVISPTIGLNLGLAFNPSVYNYAHISEFGRYYFINDWIYEAGLWYAKLSVDALASWKTNIGASNQYILRSAHIYDGNVVDGLYPIKAGITTLSDMIDTPFEYTITNGSYVVGIINPDLSGTGAVSYYVFTQSQFNDLCDALLSDAAWLDIDPSDMSEEVLKSVFNPFQYIVSCTWFPFMAPTIGAALTSVKFGWWEMVAACSRLSTLPLNFTTPTFTIPKHPQVARGNYLNLAPYSRYTLFFNPFGVIPIDTTTIINLTTISAIIHTDCITGQACLSLSTDGTFSKVFAEYRAAVGVQVQLAQMTRDYIGAGVSILGGTAGVIGNVIAGNIQGAVTGGASAILSAVNAMLPQMQSSGSNGTISGYAFNPVLLGQFYPVVDETLEHRGRPLCQEKQISTMPGFIMVSDADLEIAATSQENATIKQFMENGFFYE